MPAQILVADFIVDTPQERDAKLAKALSTAKLKAATDSKYGILVTRHDFYRFSVHLTTAVPYGNIHESDQAQR